jgi:hypothetical protein
MDDIDERIAFGRLVEPLVRELVATGTQRREALDALWRERAALTPYLVLRAPCETAATDDDPDGRAH